MTQDSQKQILRLSLDAIRQHPLDPFLPYEEEKLRELADSIAQFGLLEPIIVRKEPDGANRYEILAGKNRANAVRLNGGADIEAVMVEADDDTALMIITDSNLKHRDRLLPSERGFAYKIQLEAMSRQGKRADLQQDATCAQVEHKLKSAHKVAQHNKISKTGVHRYIRLTYLIPELLQKVDTDEIPFTAGVDLSHLNKPDQQIVYKFFYTDHINCIDMYKSNIIKNIYKANKNSITAEKLEELFYKRRYEQYEDRTFYVSRKKLAALIKDKELPDNDTLMNMFAEFVKRKLKAKGVLEIERRKPIYY